MQNKKTSNFNELVCGDTVYEITPAYREGAIALRDNVSYRSNPYPNTGRLCDSHDAWATGHSNEEAGEHFRFGKDIIYANDKGIRFEEDTSVPRDNDGNVLDEWYRLALKADGGQKTDRTPKTTQS